MTPSRPCIRLCFLLALFLAGCDPVRTTLQPVHLQVTSAADGQPVAGAETGLKFDFAASVPPLQQTADMEQWWHDRPWHSALTDRQGYADVRVEYTAIDRTIGPWPPSSRDWVSGKLYVLRVRTDDAVEQFRLVMRPGASVQGKYFAASVVAIETPRYVKTGGDP